MSITTVRHHKSRTINTTIMGTAMNTRTRRMPTVMAPKAELGLYSRVTACIVLVMVC